MAYLYILDVQAFEEVSWGGGENISITEEKT